MKQSKMQYVYEIIEKCVEELETGTCHAILEHTQKTDEQLINRIAVEKTLGASTFSEEVDAVELISDCIYDSVELISWIKQDRIKEDIIIHSDCPACGRKFIKDWSHNWQDGSLPCNTVTVILGKRFDEGNCLVGIYVKTAYPE